MAQNGLYATGWTSTQGNSYATRNIAQDVISTFPSYLIFGGDSEVVFKKSSSDPISSVSMTVHNGIEQYTIYISVYGNITLNRGPITP